MLTCQYDLTHCLRRLILIGLCGAMLAGTSSCRREDWSREAIAASKQIGDEILNAIERYCDATGHVPDSLELLVPDYLEAVKPPVAGRRKWRYAAKGASSLFRVGNLSQGWELEVEFSGDQVDHGDQVVGRAEAAGFSLGRLDQTVDGFQQSVADSRSKPAQHARPVLLDRLGRLDHRRNPTVRGPEVPLL